LTLFALAHAGCSFVSAAIRTGSGWCESLLYVSFCDACNLVVGAFQHCVVFLLDHRGKLVSQ
jgi:hypothetical protein